MFGEGSGYDGLKNIYVAQILQTAALNGKKTMICWSIKPESCFINNDDENRRTHLVGRYDSGSCRSRISTRVMISEGKKTSQLAHTFTEQGSSGASLQKSLRFSVGKVK